MGLLDRFRAQPRWKNASPAVRLAAVEELALDQQDTLVSIAREDRDPGVRIAALKKVIDPATIAALGRADTDERVREEATTLLIDLAIGAFEGTDEAESFAALAGLADQKHVVAVARAASSEPVARAALARVNEEGALGSIARRAALAPIRLEALGRVAGQTELAAVALRSEFKDVAQAAVERLADRAVLEDVANRAKNRTAAKRARALVRAAEAEAAAAASSSTAAQQADPAAAAERQRLAAAASLCGRVEALAASALDEGEAALAEIERIWSALGEIPDPNLVQRFETGRAAAQQAVTEQEAERVERARARQQQVEAAASRRDLCERVDGIAGEDTPGRLEEARTAWAALAPLGDAAEADRWQRRFDEACRGADGRYRGLVRQRTNRERAAQLVAEAERLAGLDAARLQRDDVQAIRRTWRGVAGEGLDDAALVARFDEADARLRAREAEARERQARAAQENLARVEALCGELEGLATADALTLKQAERAMREARAAIDNTPPLPARQDHERVVARLKDAVGALVPRVQELRDLDEWQRWANAGVQEELCQRVEALMALDDLALAAKQLREAQARWKEVATATRDQSQALWVRFKAASDAVRAKCDVYFAGVAEQQEANRARKEALCQQAEAASASTDWVRTAEQIKALQAEWKTVGPAPRTQEKALWERFHAACDAFFTRRRDDLQRRKGEWAANLARKEALCQQVEALAETTDWQKGMEEVKRLQAEWKTIGPVRKNRADEIWQRFRTAADAFFERYRQREHPGAPSAAADAEAVCQQAEALLPAAGAEPAPAPEGLAQQVADLRRRMSEVAAGLPRERAIRFGDRLAHALAKLAEAWPGAFVGTDLDPDANARQLEDLCAQVERLLSPEAEAATAAPAEEESSPAALLARQLREALATNTIAGRPDESAKWKAAAEQVRAAQAAWKRVGPVPDPVMRPLAARFQRACTRVTDRVDQFRRGVPGR